MRPSPPACLRYGWPKTSTSESRARASQRIVSLLPAATEILFEIGLGPVVVGVSHECDHPADATVLPKVTRSRIVDTGSSGDIDDQVRDAGSGPRYEIDRDLLASLEPDLIITQSTCSVCAIDTQEVEVIARELPGSPAVVSLQASSFESVLHDILELARAAGATGAGERLVTNLRARIERVASIGRSLTDGPTITSIEWLDPIMISGHWMPQMIRAAGGRPVPEFVEGSNPSLDASAIMAANPEVLLVAPCGFTVSRTLAEFPELIEQLGLANLTAVRNQRVYVANGNAFFTRPGPRLVDGLEILAQILHPIVFPGLIQVGEDDLRQI